MGPTRAPPRRLVLQITSNKMWSGRLVQVSNNVLVFHLHLEEPPLDFEPEVDDLRLTPCGRYIEAYSAICFLKQRRLGSAKSERFRDHIGECDKRHFSKTRRSRAVTWSQWQTLFETDSLSHAVGSRFLRAAYPGGWLAFETEIRNLCESALLAAPPSNVPSPERLRGDDEDVDYDYGGYDNAMDSSPLVPATPPADAMGSMFDRLESILLGMDGRSRQFLDMFEQFISAQPRERH
jgi:hypothetical protein